MFSYVPFPRGRYVSCLDKNVTALKVVKKISEIMYFLFASQGAMVWVERISVAAVEAVVPRHAKHLLLVLLPRNGDTQVRFASSSRQTGLDPSIRCYCGDSSLGGWMSAEMEFGVIDHVKSLGEVSRHGERTVLG